MKKVLSYSICLCFLLAFSVIFSSCCNKKDKLSEKTVLTAVNDFLDENLQYEYYTPIKVGYYEASSEERYQLRQLAANKLIEYSCDIITDNNNRNYYFVDVKLTFKGKRQSQKKMPKYIAGEDMTQPEIDESVFPESAVERIDINELSPEEKEYYLEQKKAKELNEQQKRKKDSLALIEKEKLAQLDKNSVQHTEKAYIAAQARTDFKVVFLSCYKRKAIKAKDIVLSKDKGICTANCKVVFEVTTSKPGGRIYYQTFEGTRTTQEISLIYYEDRGWSIAPQTAAELIIIDAFNIYKAAFNTINSLVEMYTQVMEVYEEVADEDAIDEENEENIDEYDIIEEEAIEETAVKKLVL